MSNPILQIAVVEDDPRLAEHLLALLSHLGWSAQAFGRADQFFAAARRQRFDAILLDLHLPDLSASRLLARLPEELRGRTIALTGRMDDWIVEESFRLGLADFLLKPYRMLELKCRILRAAQSVPQNTLAASTAPAQSLCMAGLTHRERLCAEFLLARANTIVPRTELMWHVWRLDERISSRRVDTYVSRIRQKLGLHGDAVCRLVSIYGSGYRLETPQ